MKHSSIKMVLALAVQQDMELEQLDVNIAFMHGELDEEIHMMQLRLHRGGHRRQGVFVEEVSLWP